MANQPSQALLDRQLRTVYYETEGFGSQPLKLTLGELIEYGLKGGRWVEALEATWCYQIGLSSASDCDDWIDLVFTVVEDKRYEELFVHEIILTAIRINGRALSKKEVWEFIFPLATDVRYRINMASSKHGKDALLKVARQ